MIYLSGISFPLCIISDSPFGFTLIFLGSLIPD